MDRITQSRFSGLLSLLMLVIGAGLIFGAVASTTRSATNGGNQDCPAGTALLAKFDYSGQYTFSGPTGNESMVTITNPSATEGDWTSQAAVAAIVVKGGPGSVVVTIDPAALAGTFDNQGLALVGSGQLPAISNVKFCTASTPDSTTTTPDSTTTTAPEPTTTAPEPTTTAPSDPTTTAPSDPTTTAPSDPTTTAPSDPTTTAPSDPTTTAPSDPTTTLPASTNSVPNGSTTTLPSSTPTTGDPGSPRIQSASEGTPAPTSSSGSSVTASALALTGIQSLLMVSLGGALVIAGLFLAWVAQRRRERA